MYVATRDIIIKFNILTLEWVSLVFLYCKCLTKHDIIQTIIIRLSDLYDS